MLKYALMTLFAFVMTCMILQCLDCVGVIDIDLIRYRMQEMAERANGG